MNRNEFKCLAGVRLSEAKILLDNRKYDGAYYLSGYVIECALKACIARQVRRFQFPDKNLANNCYTHDLNKLVNLANLKPDLDRHISNNNNFEINWTIVKDWSEESRYKRNRKLEASDIYLAVSDSNNGVLEWLQRHW